MQANSHFQNSDLGDQKQDLRWESLHDFDTVRGYLVELNIRLGKRFLSAFEQIDRFSFCGKGHETVVHIEVSVNKV